MLIAPLPVNVETSLSAYEVNRFTVHEELQATFAVLWQAMARLFQTAEWHGWFFIAGVNVDVSHAGIDMVDISLHHVDVTGEDGR